MKTWIMCATGTTALAVMLSGVTTAARQAEPGQLPLPLRMTAFAVNMSNVASGKTLVTYV